jgi:hypothetical protein
MVSLVLGWNWVKRGIGGVYTVIHFFLFNTVYNIVLNQITVAF